MCFTMPWVGLQCVIVAFPGPEVIKLEYSLKLKIKHNDWLVNKQPIIVLYFEFENVPRGLFIITSLLTDLSRMIFPTLLNWTSSFP